MRRERGRERDREREDRERKSQEEASKDSLMWEWIKEYSHKLHNVSVKEGACMSLTVVL